MPSPLTETILSDTPEIRNRALEVLCEKLCASDLIAGCRELDELRKSSSNLYQRVRALFFLAAVNRYHLPEKLDHEIAGRVSHVGYEHLTQRRFEEAINEFLDSSAPNRTTVMTDASASALAAAYYELAFTTLAGQVRKCVRSVKGNQWMFRMGHPLDHPLRLCKELLHRQEGTGQFPVLFEQTPVRMDLTHSAWSDIFFLGMDYPEGAQVINVSIDLGVFGRDVEPRPPVEVYLRVIDQPVLRLVSVDMKACCELKQVSETFDFAANYLGLVKAGIIAAGIIPPGLEGTDYPMSEVLGILIKPGLGLEVVTKVNDIPKGSRLAVSTNLLAGIIAACMRATGQVSVLTGALTETDRRLVAARAILGEWQGGSGGGWQDSGGVWPGFKLIKGELAVDGDSEFGTSRGRLLPRHHVYTDTEIPSEARKKLCDSLVLVHGGMAQDVGPILRMVTEKYLLRSEHDSRARQQAIDLLRDVESALMRGDIQSLAKTTTQNFNGPIQTIIPWACNHYTQTLIERCRAKWGDQFWGFLMLGGMSGGGMGFFFDPAIKPAAQRELQRLMSETKRELQDAFPFAMEPVVYDFHINPNGTSAQLLLGKGVSLPAEYYALVIPDLVKTPLTELPPLRRAELLLVSEATAPGGSLTSASDMLLNSLLPRLAKQNDSGATLKSLLNTHGFDSELHEQIRTDLATGRIGLAQNRLSIATAIDDVTSNDITLASRDISEPMRELGRIALAHGEVAILSLAAGAGSRWTRGAGVVKALHRFHRFKGQYRTFLEVHLAKTRRIAREYGAAPPHLFATSYLTDGPIQKALRDNPLAQGLGIVRTSPSKSVGLRMIPMVRDLRFAWEETTHQVLDEQAEKMRQSVHSALIHWAESTGCGSDYTENLPGQCLHPVGHWFEVPSLLRNGVLKDLLESQPQLKYLMMHNIDTLGANLDPGLLGNHIHQGGCLTFEVIPRRIEDRGGGLAKIDGRIRLIEGLALPREEDEFRLSYYNTLTTWIQIDKLLAAFGLSRADLSNTERVTRAVRELSQRLPTYITIKDVKRRWGHGQEDIFPVSQFEKLWGDMSAVPGIDSQFVVVPRQRGQQLKEQAQLDGWLRDGSAAWIESLGDW